MYKIKESKFNATKNEWEKITHKMGIENAGERVVDDTHFRPNVNEWNNVAGTTNTDNGYYDFENGIDNGSRIRMNMDNPKLDIVERNNIANAVLASARNYKDNATKEINTAVEDTVNNLKKLNSNTNKTMKTE